LAASVTANQADDLGRIWKWDQDGTLEGLYVCGREVHVSQGPSAGKTKLTWGFHVGLEDELVTVFETAVLVSEFAKELALRGKPDFEPGERITIKPGAKRPTRNGQNTYRPLEISYEHAAPQPTMAERLVARARSEPDPEPNGDDDLPF
jgi:hypothetical protein